jgi:protein-S-isoprenylcysteine O-methyltransferase Ste14
MTPLVAKIAWCAGIIGWYIIRYPYQRRSRRIPVVQIVGRGRDLTLLAISFSGLFVIPVIFVLADWPRFADYPFEPSAAWVGVAVFALSLALFYRTHRDLGRFWSVTLEIRQTHQIVTSGVYKHIRHPMYAAFFLWATAQALLLPNWIAGPAGIVGFGILFCLRVPREEQMMEAAFGDAYREYAARTSRLLPRVF